MFGKNITKKLSIFLSIFLSFELFASNIIYDDFNTVNSLKGVDLGGHSVVIEKGGLILERITNGEIKVSSSVGTGLVTLKNCQKVSVVLEGTAYLILDNKTQIETLFIKNNARINSFEAFEGEIKNKKPNLKKKPLIKEIIVEPNKAPVIDNIQYDKLVTLHPESGIYKGLEKLRITNDTLYKGLGARFIIENPPKNADCLFVLLLEKGTEKELEWISADSNREKYFSGFYEYEYLKAGNPYEFIFWYTKGTETLAKYHIKTVPEKGAEISFDKADIKLNIDEQTGNIKWLAYPKDIKLPDDSELTYEIISLDKDYNWYLIGKYKTYYKNFESLNIYEDFDWEHPERIIDKKVFLHIYFSYETFRWPIIKETEQFTVKK